MSFFPREVVVVVNFLLYICAKNAGNLGANPISSRIRIFTGELHALNIFLAERAIRIEQHRINMNALLAAAFFYKVACETMAQTARAEMHADPDPILFIDEDVHVMIAASHRT